MSPFELKYIIVAPLFYNFTTLRKGEQPMTTNYEDQELQEVIEYLSEIPGGAEMFKKYYVESGLASSDAWQRFLESGKEKK